MIASAGVTHHTRSSLRYLITVLAVLGCKEATPPAPPVPALPSGEILTKTFAYGGEFVPSALEFQGVRADGSFGILIVTTQRRPSTAPFNVERLFNCPKTTWSQGRPSTDPRASCGSFNPLQRPRCRLVEVMARAIEEGASTSAPAVVSIHDHGPTPDHDGPVWRVQADKPKPFAYPDDCEPNVEEGGTIPRRLPKLPTVTPVAADELTRLASEWLAEKHPTLVPNRIAAVGLAADGVLDATRGGYSFTPGVIWPPGKPKLDMHHFGGSAPYGICRDLWWSYAQGWRLGIRLPCANIKASPRCSLATVWRHARAQGLPEIVDFVEFADGNWIIEEPRGTVRARHDEAQLDCGT